MSGLGRVFVPACVLAMLALARRYMPAASDVAYSDEDAQRFSRLQWAVALAMIGTGVLFGAVTYNGLLWTNHALASGATSRFMLLPSHSTWFFLPLFGGLSLAWELTFRFWKWLGDPLQAEKYASWSNSKVGYDATRLLRLLIVSVTLPVAVATLLALPIHTDFTESGMSVGRFGTLKVTYRPFEDIREVTITDGLRLRDGSSKRRPAIVLTFWDGTRWSSADNHDPERSIDASLLQFLREKTRLPIAHIAAFPFGTV